MYSFNEHVLCNKHLFHPWFWAKQREVKNRGTLRTTGEIRLNQTKTIQLQNTMLRTSAEMLIPARMLGIGGQLLLRGRARTQSCLPGETL